MAARSGRGLFRTGSSARGLPTSPLSRSGSLPHLSWAFAKGKSKVHPDDEAKDGDDDVGLLRQHLGSSLNVDWRSGTSGPSGTSGRPSRAGSCASRGC